MKNYDIKIGASDIENKCSIKLVQENIASVSNDLKNTIITSQKNYRKRMNKARKLCAKADKKYLFYGLKDLIPSSWECDLSGERKDIFNNLIINMIFKACIIFRH